MKWGDREVVEVVKVVRVVEATYNIRYLDTEVAEMSGMRIPFYDCRTTKL